jgi:uncharacterized membrane protein YjgN (DUF898 family)
VLLVILGINQHHNEVLILIQIAYVVIWHNSKVIFPLVDFLQILDLLIVLPLVHVHQLQWQ